MNGFNVAEAGHVVNILPPVDITGGKTAQAFNMKRHKHASIIIQIGVSAAAFTKILLNLCSDASGTGPTAIPFFLYKQETAGASNDVLSTRTAVTSAGYTPAATDGIFYVIEIDANELEASGVGIGECGVDAYLQLQLTNTANSVIASAVAVLTGARDAEVASPTVCT
jgi:hypothetical protein